MEALHQTFSLSLEACDEISMLVQEFCEKAGAERKDAVRYRLSVEECLVFWIEHGLEGTAVEVNMGRRLFSPFIQIEAEGPSLNPYTADEDLGAYAGGILASLDLSPEFAHTNGKNRIRFRVKKKERGQLETLGMVVAAAALVGVAGLYLIPDNIRTLALETLINPVYDAFFRLLGSIAGPMIFLSVAWGIYGIGDASTFNRVGKKVMLRYVATVMVVAACAGALFPILGPPLSDSDGGNGQFASVAELLFGIIPSSIVEPFATGNTLQIIFMGIVIGIALLYLGRQTSMVAAAIEQVNLIVQFLMDFIARLVPYVIFLVIINLIWSNNASIFATAWKPIVVLIISLAFACTVFVLLTAIRMKVSPIKLARKGMPTFLVALTTASSAAAFSTNVKTCEDEFGIDPSLLRFGIPLGMVMHKAATSIVNLVLLFHFAKQFGVSCSVAWVAIAVFISAILAIAAPPIPGGGAIAYSILFPQMGIPMEALAIALAIDAVIDFPVTASEMIMMPMSLINIASELGMIDREKLRS